MKASGGGLTAIFVIAFISFFEKPGQIAVQEVPLAPNLKTSSNSAFNTAALLNPNEKCEKGEVTLSGAHEVCNSLQVL